jgi:hypothetical protein
MGERRAWCDAVYADSSRARVEGPLHPEDRCADRCGFTEPTNAGIPA